jgi:hypothetical protein
MRTRLRVLGGSVTAVALAAVAVPLLTTSQAEAARFTGGNIVVYRVGSGTALTNAAAPVYLDEYAPGGAKVQSVALPTAAAEGNHRLTAVGQSRSEGLVSRSADGRYLVVTGYDAAVGATGPGGASLTASSPDQVGRVVGFVDANGVVDTTTVLQGSGAAKIIRSAASTQGDRLWATGGNGGVLTTNRGAADATVAAGSATSNFSALTIQGGQLFTSGILANRLAALGSGTPTTGALTDLPGLPGNLLTYGYAFADLTPAGYGSTPLDTLYLANGSERGGTIDKYRWTGAAWSPVGYVDVEGVLGVVADVQNGAVSLAVTTPTSLVSLTDPNGAAAAFAPSAPAVLASAAPGTEFRGVALAPTAPAGPSVYLRSPLVGANVPLADTITVTAYVDSPVGVSSVKAKVAGGGFVTATRSGHLWTAKVPAAGLKAGASTVTVTATDTASATTTATRAVKLGGSTTPKGALGAGSYAWSAKQVKLTGTWKTYKTKASPTKKGKTSTSKKSAAKVKVYGHKLTLSFDRTAKGGKVKVVVDGKATTLSLYDKAGKPLKKSWAFKGALKTHQVIVTVLGTKAPASKGTAVFLAALKVKA